jgi:predicted transcriptional regulator
VRRFHGKQIEVARKLNASTAAVSKWYSRAVKKTVELDETADKILSKMPSMLSGEIPKSEIVYGFKHSPV